MPQGNLHSTRPNSEWQVPLVSIEPIAERSNATYYSDLPKFSV